MEGEEREKIATSNHGPINDKDLSVIVSMQNNENKIEREKHKKMLS
jgi:hypothetical protein